MWRLRKTLTYLLRKELNSSAICCTAHHSTYWLSTYRAITGLLVLNIKSWNSTGCRRRLCLGLLWPWPLTFWPQNPISTSMNPSTSVTRIGIGWNSLHWFLRYGVHRVFVTYTLGRIHPKTVCFRHREKFSMTEAWKPSCPIGGRIYSIRYVSQSMIKLMIIKIL